MAARTINKWSVGGPGKTSFRELDDYVHGLYHAIPGRLLREPLPETAMYNRYLHYIASLDKFSADDDEDGKEAARVPASKRLAS